MEQANFDKSILDEKSQNLNMMEYQKEFKKVYLDTLNSLDTIEQRDDFNDQAMLFIKEFTHTVEFNQKYKSAKSTALHLLNNTLNNILENRASHSVELNSMVGMNPTINDTQCNTEDATVPSHQSSSVAWFFGN